MFIVNPASRNGKTGKRWPHLARELSRGGLDFSHCVTTEAGEGIELSRQAVEQGYNTIVAVGGDGTLNEVVNGFFQNGENLFEGTFLMLSQGTGGDFVRSLGLPRDVPGFFKLLEEGSPFSVDLGRVCYRDLQNKEQNRYFVNIADVGLSGEAVYRVNTTSKALGGFVSFFAGALKAILKYRNQYMEVEMAGEKSIKARICCLVAANGRYFGGGMCIAPRASVDSGTLSVVMIGDMSKVELIRNLPKVYKGTHLQHRFVENYQTSSLTVRPQKPLYLDLDGEHFPIKEASMDLLPGALQVLRVPKQSHEGEEEHSHAS